MDSEALDAFDDDDEKHRRLTLDQAIETLSNAEIVLTADINQMEQECGEWLKTFEAYIYSPPSSARCGQSVCGT